jgi:hypothetical protein
MMRRTAFLFFLIASLHCAHAARYAFLVGNNEAQGNYAQLKYVQNDIISVKEILSGFCGFDKQHIMTLVNGTPEALERSIDDFARQMAGTKDNMFLFYYSGHADENSLKMGSGDYPLVTLKQKLTNFPSDMRIAIFDACQSGSFTRIKGGRLDEPFLFKDDGKTKGQVILCSSSISENAQESDALGNSIFTFHFVNALRGSGDLNGDGRVTLSEAYQYSYNHTLSSTAGSSGGVQHPSYQFRIQGEGDIVLADLNVSSQGILLSPGVTGDITILSVNNTVVADLTKEKNSAIMIALAPGAYRIVNGTPDNRRRQASATVKESAIVNVGKDMFAPVETGPGRTKGALGWERSLRIGVTLSGGYTRFDFFSLASDLGREFGMYHDFSIDPVFAFQKYKQQYQIAAEAIVRGRFVASVGYGTFDWSSSGDYSGNRVNQADGASYACRLHMAYSVHASVTDLGTGFRFPKGYLKNAFLLIGVSIFDVSLNVNSIFTDSLYDIQTHGNGTDRGSITVPSIAAGYEWPLTKWCDIGAKIRYRYQKSATVLDNSNSYDEANGQNGVKQNAMPFRYNFGGLDGNLFVNFHLTFARSEQQQ